MRSRSSRWRDLAEDAALRALLRAALALPYERRVPVAGWMAARLVSPLAGYGRRVQANLRHVCPELSEAEVAQLVRAVPDNLGRSLIEIYSGPEFAARARTMPMTGAGVPALAQAHEEGRPVLLATGHFGNYDAPRAALLGRGYRVGGLYSEMRNSRFHAHYLRAISAIGTPLFPRTRRGMAQMVRFLRAGGMVGIVADQHVQGAPYLDFFGKPARTALSAAELALRHKALLVPIYGIRQPDGLSFQIIAEAPVPHGDPVAMTQALNDSLEAHVRRHMAQWLWIHRRWKPGPIPG